MTEWFDLVVRKAVERAGFGSDRFQAKRCDLAATLADQGVPEAAGGDGNFDCCLMIFLLSAAPPSAHEHIVRNAWRLLRPGESPLVGLLTSLAERFGPAPAPHRSS